MQILEGQVAIVASRIDATQAVVRQDCSEKRLEVCGFLRLEAPRPEHALQFGGRGSRDVKPTGIPASEASKDTLVDGLPGVQAEQDVHGLRENVVHVSQVSRPIGNLKELVDAINDSGRIELPRAAVAALEFVGCSAGLVHRVSSPGMAHQTHFPVNTDAAYAPAAGADRVAAT